MYYIWDSTTLYQCRTKGDVYRCITAFDLNIEDIDVYVEDAQNGRIEYILNGNKLVDRCDFVTNYASDEVGETAIIEIKTVKLRHVEIEVKTIYVIKD